MLSTCNLQVICKLISGNDKEGNQALAGSVNFNIERDKSGCQKKYRFRWIEEQTIYGKKKKSLTWFPLLGNTISGEGEVKSGRRYKVYPANNYITP